MVYNFSGKARALQGDETVKDLIFWIILILSLFMIARGGVSYYFDPEQGKQNSSNSKPPGQPKKNGENSQSIDSDRRRSLEKEYELSQGMHNYYGRIIWEIGSIFIGGGLAFIGFAASEPKTYPFFGFFALAFTILMLGYYFMNRRWRDIAEIHLVRCRQIEVKLGLRQHFMVKQANSSDGYRVLDGRRERWFRVPFPSGWSTVQGIIFGLTMAVWFIAFYLTQIHPA